MVTTSVRARNFLGVFAPAPPPPGGAIARLPFADNFEANNFNAWDAVGGTVTLSTLETYDGVRSASTLAINGQQSDNYLEFNFGDAVNVAGTPTGINDIWIRFAHKWASNYVDTGALGVQKMLLLNIHNPATGARRYQMTFNVWTPDNGYFFEFLRWLETGGANGVATPNINLGLTRVKGRWEEFVFRVRMNNVGVTDGHLQAWTKVQGDTSYTQRLNLTNVNFRESTAFTPNRLLVSDFNTGTTRSGARYWDSIQLQQAPIDVSSTPPPADNDGLVVTNYATYDPDAAQIISLDVNSGIPQFNTGGATTSIANEEWWNGSSVPVATMRPPTVNDSYNGFGAIPFWKNATKAVRQMNFRTEFRVSDAYCSITNLPKWFLFQTARTLNAFAEINDRPMYFIGRQDYGTSNDIPNTLIFSAAQGTSQMYNSTNLIPGPTSSQWVDGYSTGDGPTTWSVMRQPMYIRATAGVDGGGNPILAASEILCIECRINVMSTTDEPNGIIAYRMYRRNGNIFERGVAWTWEAGKLVNTNYLIDIQAFGGGYYNGPNSGASNIWTKIGRRVTIGFNLQPTVGRYWIGPPAGFVTG